MAPWPPENREINWADAAGWQAPEPSKPPSNETLLEVFATYNRKNQWNPDHLLLGLSVQNGQREMMDLANPRSLVIEDHFGAARDILRSMVTAIKLRKDQKHLPITVITNDHSSWANLGKSYRLDLAIASPSETSILRKLAYREPSDRQFLVIDELSQLVKLGAHDESILRFLIHDGAEAKGVHVLASYSTTTNIKTNNTVEKWVGYGNILTAETSGSRIITLEDGTDIYVPTI